MSETILQEIRKVEEEAARLISSAQKQAADTVAKAHARSVELLMKQEEELKEFSKKGLADEAEKMRKAKEKAFLASGEQVKVMKKSASSRIDRAVSFAVEKFREVSE